jgi:AcrR family transcriptional regulator
LTSAPAAATRPYRSSQREARAAATRERILTSFAEQLGRPGATDVNVVEAARVAGVSVRTVYHHFPDRTARLEALAGWLSEQFGPVQAPLERAADLPDYVRAAYARAAAHEALTRAGLVAGMATDIRLLRLAGTRRRIRQLLDEIGAPAADTARAAAVIAVLESSEAGFPLVEYQGLTFAEAGEAAADAVAAIIKDLGARARLDGRAGRDGRSAPEGRAGRRNGLPSAHGAPRRLDR